MRIGAETTWRPSKPVRAGQQALAQVRIWDAYDRESTPGFTDYTYDDQQFTYSPSGAAVGVTALAATTQHPTPRLSLAWSRAEQPDEWLISRDGVQVLRAPGSALLRAGTQVVYDARNLLTPSGRHTWTVAPVVNGAVSKNAGVAEFESHHPGSWLVDPETGDMVCIVGDVDHGTATPEDSATFVPLGSQVAVVVTSGMRGREGKVEGVLAPISRMPADQTVALWRKRLLRFKSDRGLVLRFLSERDDIPVLISDVSVVPDARKAEGGPLWRVAFNWRQAGEFDFDGTHL